MQNDLSNLIGTHEAKGMAGDNMLQQLEHLKNLTPPLSQFILQDGLGDLFASSTFEYRDWALLTLGVLVAMGDTGDQLKVYLEAAVQHGTTDDEVLAVINHACLYAGAPRAVNAARHLADYLTGERQKRLPSVVEKVVRIGDYDSRVWDNGGEGPAMLLIHALDTDCRFWRAVYPGLAPLGRVIAYDLRGHGKGRGGPPVTSLDQLADDASRLLDLLGIGQVDVYGSSYGGAVAQHLVLKEPDRVRSLALIATVDKSPRDPLLGRAVNAEEHGMEAQVAESLIRWFLPETIARNGWEVRYARQCITRCRVEDWASAWRAMASLDVRARSHEIKCPVLVLSGKQDLSTTPEMMKATADNLPNAQYQLVDPGTHFMPIEQPEAVAKALADFRRKIDRTQPA